MIKNTLSIDLESYLHRQFKNSNTKEQDDGYTVKATEIILDLFRSYNLKTTFFVVGEIYEWYPGLIEKIKKEGHEVGYHSHNHIILKDRETLIAQLNNSELFLKKYKPTSFRAPRMHLKEDCLELLREHGFSRDSSIYDGEPFITKQKLTEIPVSLIGSSRRDFPQSTKNVFLRGFPIGSGIYMSLFGKNLQHFIGYLNQKGKFANLFIHPWQIIPYHNREVSLTLAQKLVYRGAILKTLEYLLSKNLFVPLRDLRT